MYRWTFKCEGDIKTGIEDTVDLCATWIDVFIIANEGKEYEAYINKESE